MIDKRRCNDCGQEFGTFGYMVPVFQMNLSTDEPEQIGFVHQWHLLNPEPTP